MVLDHAIISTIANNYKTGNVIIDFLIVSAVSAVVLSIWNNSKIIKQYILSKVSTFKFNKYKHTLEIVYDNIFTSNSQIRNIEVYGLNVHNKIIIDGVLKYLSENNNAIELVSEYDILNTKVSGSMLTRDGQLKSHLSYIPKSQFKFKGMQFKFFHQHTISYDKAISTTVKITMSIQTNDIMSTHAFLEECKHKEINASYPLCTRDCKQYSWNIAGIYNGLRINYYTFTRYPWKSNKTFDTIYFARKKELMHLIDDFTASTGPWHPSKQRTNSCKIFLHGLPGTGKTSIVKAIANYTNRDIIQLDLKLIKSNADLINVVNSTNIYYYPTSEELLVERLPLSKRLYVLEDLDADECDELIAPRTFKETVQVVPIININGIEDVSKDKEKSKLNLCGLLAALDGYNEPDGAMFIISTNYINKFDNAIYRPGRMDINLELGYMTNEDIKSYLETYYVADFDIDCLENITVRNIVPSMVEQICQAHNNIEDAIKAINSHN